MSERREGDSSSRAYNAKEFAETLLPHDLKQSHWHGALMSKTSKVAVRVPESTNRTGRVLLEPLGVIGECSVAWSNEHDIARSHWYFRWRKRNALHTFVAKGDE